MLTRQVYMLKDKSLAYFTRRKGDLYGTRSILGRAKRNMARAFKGVENVYTQHSPLLSDTIAKLADNSLPGYDYPYAGEPRVGAHHCCSTSTVLLPYALFRVYV